MLSKLTKCDQTDRTTDVHIKVHTSKLPARRQCSTCVRKWPGHARKDRDKHADDRVGLPDGRAGFAGPLGWASSEDGLQPFPKSLSKHGMRSVSAAGPICL